MNALVDWFCATWKHVKNLDSFFNYFRLPKDEFIEGSSRRLGTCVYQKSLRWDYIIVYYNIVLDNAGNEYFDVCLNFSGQGCRNYEMLRGKDFDWKAFFKDARAFAELRKGFYADTYNVARLDVAYDVFDNGCPNMLSLISAVMKHKYKSKFRNVLPAPGNCEQWIYFGSPQSDTRLRIYNKALERKRHDIDKWVRFEYQLRNESADRFLSHLMGCDSVGEAMRDFLNASVMFTTKPNTHIDDGNHHSDRLRPARWWSSFVEGAQQIEKFYVPGVNYNMQGVNKYIENQVAPSLYTKLMADGGDVTPLLELIMRNKDRLNEKQKNLLNEIQLRDNRYSFTVILRQVLQKELEAKCRA